jgi:glutathione S-transferase
MIYLAEKFNHKTDLLLKKEAYPKVLQWLFFSLSTLEASDEEMASNSEPAPFAPLVDTFEFINQETKNREFIAGSSFSLADIALTNGLKWFGMETIKRYPNVLKYFNKHTARSSFRKIVEQEEYPKNSAGSIY